MKNLNFIIPKTTNKPSIQSPNSPKSISFSPNHTYQNYKTIHDKSKYILPTFQDFSQLPHNLENSTVNNARTPTEKYTYLQTTLPKTPNNITENKYFKSSHRQTNTVEFKTQPSKNQFKSYLINEAVNNPIENRQPQTSKIQFRNSGQQQKKKVQIKEKQSDQYSFIQNKQARIQGKLSKFQHLANQHKQRKIQNLKKIINLKQTSSTLSTINIQYNKKQQNLSKVVSDKQKSFHNNKLSKSDFLILKNMGQGKFGDVYMVKHKATGFIAALKCINKKKIIQQKLVNQLIRQLKIQSYLNHPNIISFYGSFQDKQNVYLLLQLGTQGQLYDKLKKYQKYSEETAAFIIKSLLSAVQYMHSQKLIHRDIKPQNIVIVHGNVKLCDFGWAVYRGNDLRNTFCGTPLYVSPEILKGELYDQKTDIWAIGILAYELVIGNLPFQITKEEQLIKIIKQQIIFPNKLDISKQYKDFVLKILKKNPKQRLTCDDLLKHSFIVRYSEFETCEELCSS